MNGVSGNEDGLPILIHNLMYIWCASRFLRIQLQGKLWEEMIFAGLLFCNYEAIAILLTRTDIPYIVYATYAYVVLILITIAVFKGENEKKLLAAVIWTVMFKLFGNFSESFLSFLWLVLSRIITGQAVSVIGIWEQKFLLAITCVSSIIAFHLLSKPFRLILADKRKSWYLSVTLPLSFLVFIIDLANWAATNGIMVHDWGKFGLFENQLFSHGAMCIFTGLAMMASGLLVFGMNRIDQEDRAKEQYHSQVMYYQMMEEQYGQMERLRHDMKNHMIVLENLIQNRQWEKADRYRTEMAKAGGMMTADDVTGSLIIDALLYHKRKQADDWGIHWQCDAKLPGNCPIKEIDLCIILGNILDNALEACQILLKKSDVKKIVNELFIYVRIGTIKKCLFLEVQNSTVQTEGSKINKSRKENPNGHGIGIRNIKAAAANYNGAVQIESENSVFTISVLLPFYEEKQPC